MNRIAFVAFVAGLAIVAPPAAAQDGRTGDRGLSVMGGVFSGAFDNDRNMPLLVSRYRFQTARWGAAEVELGAGRFDDGCSAIAISTGSVYSDCDADHYTVVTAALTYGVSVPVGRIRPFAFAGFGGMAALEHGVAPYGLTGGGVAVRVVGVLSVRAEIGRRFNGEGGATQLFAGVELDVTGR